MQTRLSVLISRFAAYWTWWRTLLLVVAVAAMALATTTNSTGLAAAAVVVAALPLAALFALLGDRVAQHHLALANAPNDRSVQNAETHTGAARSVPSISSGTLSILVDPGPGGDELLNVLQTLHELAPAAECVVGLASQGDDALIRLLAPIMNDWPTLACHRVGSMTQGTSPFDELLHVATGRFVLMIEVGRTAVEQATLTPLLATIPGPDQRWIGLRRSGSAALIGRGALIESGGCAAPDLEGRLIDNGFVIDDLAHPLGLDFGAGGVARRGVPHAARELENGAARGRVLLVALASYHTEELFPLAAALGEQGVASTVAVPSQWVQEVAPAILSSDLAVHELPAPGGWLADVAVVVVLNDWDAEVAQVIAAARRYGVPTIAKVEGVQDFADLDVPIDRQAYRHADHVLCQGRNDARALDGRPTTIVGSSRLERLWMAPPRPVPLRPLAVINVNFTFGVLEEQRELFVASALEGCRLAGIDVVVSAHPHERGAFDGVPVATEPMSELLRRASVLISRFSTVPFEAMARGVPFVYHNPHGERVPDFSEPAGAFEVSTDAASVALGINAALAYTDDYRSRCASFFEAQVDVDPQRSSAQRAAAAVLEISGPTGT